MNKIFPTAFRLFRSDNRKSKTCGEQRRTIEKRPRRPKWIVVVGFVVTFAMCGAVAQAQQPGTIPRVGYVSGNGNPEAPGPRVEALRQGLRDLGYIEGKNILVEYHYTEGKLDRVPSLVADLVRRKVDVLLFGGVLPAMRAAKQATKTIPIVFVTGVDPVASGLVDSLARPGGNITGLTGLTRELSGKRLELLKEMVPGISRVGLLRDTNAAGAAIGLKEYETTARALKMRVQSLEVRGPNPDFVGAFQAATKGRVSGLITIASGVTVGYSKRIAELAIKNRLPSMCERSEYVENGCLGSYASNDADQYRRAAVYVDKILKGTKPADLPVEQPMKFELVFNLNTAKQIGFTIPPNLLVRAQRVIR